MKNNYKQILIFIIIFSSIFFIGCIDVYVNEHINSDNSTEIEIIYDFEQLMNLKDMMGDMNDSDYNETQEILFEPNIVCETFYEDQSDFGLSDVDFAECIVEGNKAIIRATKTQTEHEIILNNDKTYTINFNKDYEYFKEEALLDDESNNETESMKMIYTIHFENDIIESPYGEIENNKLIFNLTTLNTITEDFSVKAKLKESETNQNNEISNEIDDKENNNFLIYIIIGIGIIIISGIFIFSLKKKKNKFTQTTSSQPRISPRIEQLINWIKTYENNYSKEVLREHLKKYNYSEEEINEAYKNK
jgi:hypothetical protein